MKCITITSKEGRQCSVVVQCRATQQGRVAAAQGLGAATVFDRGGMFVGLFGVLSWHM
jgi:hypothetical protein